MKRLHHHDPLRLVALAPAIFAVLTACTPPDELLDASELKVSAESPALPWDDLMAEPEPGEAALLKGVQGTLDSDEELEAPKKGDADSHTQVEPVQPPAAETSSMPAILAAAQARLAQLPPLVQERPQLARLVAAADLEEPILFHGGVYGKRGPAKAFVASLSDVPDYDRLYWVMVHMLSEKYGCFMTKKLNQKNTSLVRCRDGRRVMFWKSRGKEWIQFVARQYDREGYEIVVRKRQIIRVSREQILAHPSQDGV